METIGKFCNAYYGRDICFFPWIVQAFLEVKLFKKLHSYLQSSDDVWHLGYHLSYLMFVGLISKWTNVMNT